MRKGQAALEYLITYGWGFVVIMVVVGGLAYFGMFSPSRYIPSRCDFGAQLECYDYQLDSAGVVRLQFRNNFGDDIQIVSMHLFEDTAPAGVSASSFIIAKGNISQVFTVTPVSSAELVEGDRISVPVTITFQRASGGSPPLHNLTGEVFATVQ